jgi:hypothetical protein
MESLVDLFGVVSFCRGWGFSFELVTIDLRRVENERVMFLG